jgi:hypothetical protein
VAKVNQMDLKYRDLFEKESELRPGRILKAQSRLSISKKKFENLLRFVQNCTERHVDDADVVSGKACNSK